MQIRNMRLFLTQQVALTNQCYQAVTQCWWARYRRGPGRTRTCPPGPPIGSPTSWNIHLLVPPPGGIKNLYGKMYIKCRQVCFESSFPDTFLVIFLKYVKTRQILAKNPLIRKYFFVNCFSQLPNVLKYIFFFLILGTLKSRLRISRFFFV